MLRACSPWRTLVIRPRPWGVWARQFAAGRSSTKRGWGAGRNCGCAFASRLRSTTSREPAPVCSTETERTASEDAAQPGVPTRPAKQTRPTPTLRSRRINPRLTTPNGFIVEPVIPQRPFPKSSRRHTFPTPDTLSIAANLLHGPVRGLAPYESSWFFPGPPPRQQQAKAITVLRAAEGKGRLPRLFAWPRPPPHSAAPAGPRRAYCRPPLAAYGVLTWLSPPGSQFSRPRAWLRRLPAGLSF